MSRSKTDDLLLFALCGYDVMHTNEYFDHKRKSGMSFFDKFAQLDRQLHGNQQFTLSTPQSELAHVIHHVSLTHNGT